MRDNGIGIPGEMLSKIFDLFTQVERSLDRSQGGLGIGLTPCNGSCSFTAARSRPKATGPEREANLPCVSLPSSSRAPLDRGRTQRRSNSRFATPRARRR